MKAGARVACAVACVAVVLFLARYGVADAVFARGDDAARAGRLVVAATYYQRAQTIGGDSLEGLERYALLALLAPRGKVPPFALRSADAFLEGNARSAPGHFDRGLIEWRTGAYAASARDFWTAWTIGRDPRAAAFARAALRRARRGGTRWTF